MAMSTGDGGDGAVPAAAEPQQASVQARSFCGATPTDATAQRPVAGRKRARETLRIGDTALQVGHSLTLRPQLQPAPASGKHSKSLMTRPVRSSPRMCVVCWSNPLCE